MGGCEKDLRGGGCRLKFFFFGGGGVDHTKNLGGGSEENYVFFRGGGSNIKWNSPLHTHVTKSRSKT